MALTATEEALIRQLLDQQAAILSLAGNESTITSKLGATKVTLADLAAASAIGDTDLFLVRQGTTEKSVLGSIIKALFNAPDSSTTVKGLVELATNTEAQTGTDAVRAVTPAALASVTSTETRAGLIELATDAEAQAFTANKGIDGAKLATALKGANQSLIANGYQKLPGGLIIQWGEVSQTAGTEGSVAITFPISFPNACLQVVPGLDGGTWSTMNQFNFAPQTLGKTASGFTYYLQMEAASSGSGTYKLTYIAIGY